MHACDTVYMKFISLILLIFNVHYNIKNNQKIELSIFRSHYIYTTQDNNVQGAVHSLPIMSLKAECWIK